MSTIRIATRDSDLALWQARDVARRIEAALSVATQIVPLTTTGDRLQGSLAKVGGKGLFVKEIEEALLANRAEVAVHSAKDLPARLHPDLALAAFPERADPRDALVVAEDAPKAKVSSGAPARGLVSLREGARVGTGSVRRAAQLLRLRKDLEIAPLRGNVPTRLRKLEDEGLDAIVLACAGLDRLGFGDRIAERIAADALLPAVAQGALAVQSRADTSVTRDLAAIGHAETTSCVRAERAFLAGLGGDCNVPIAALATIEGDTLTIRGMVISPDGERAVSGQASVPLSQAERAGEEIARDVLADGGDVILAALHAEAAS